MKTHLGLAAMFASLAFQSAHTKTMETITAQEIEQLINDTDAAMKSAGVEPDENGQHKFGDVVFHDSTLTLADKINLLELCDQSDKRIAAQIAELKQMAINSMLGTLKQ